MHQISECTLAVKYLHFRPLVISDAPALITAIRASASSISPWVSTPATIRSLSTARAAIAEELLPGRPARYGGLSDAGELAVSSRLFILDHSPLDIEIGVWRSKAFSSRGVGRWAVANAIRTAFEFGAIVATLRHSVQNERSRRMMEVLGLEPSFTLAASERVGVEVHDALVYKVQLKQWPSLPGYAWSQPCRKL